MPSDQFPVGGHVDLAIGETQVYEWEADKTTYISLAEFVSDTAGVQAALRFLREDGSVTFPRVPDHGDADPHDNHVNGADSRTYPIRVGTSVGDSRYTMLYQLQPGETLKFELNGDELAAAAQVRFRAAAASTLAAAVGGRGGGR